MSLLDELRTAARTVSATVGPTVVAIGRTRRGAGTVVARGQVVTNAHNLRDRTTQVTFADGSTAQATVLGIDFDHDLAVLAVDTGDAPVLEWADHAAEPGDVVFAAGPHGRGSRVTMGLVTTVGRSFRGPRGRRIDGSVEHSAPLARGSSGGPLVDPSGRLVALNTHRLGDGFTLALPADAELRRRIDELGRGEVPERKRLGVAVASAEVTRRLRRAVGLPERAGLLVRGVEGDSPAEQAGIREGDLLVSAAGIELTDTDALFAALEGDAPTLDLVVVRGADERTITVQFGPTSTDT
jgi:serine protease Do